MRSRAYIECNFDIFYINSLQNLQHPYHVCVQKHEEPICVYVSGGRRICFQNVRKRIRIEVDFSSSKCFIVCNAGAKIKTFSAPS